MKRAEIMKQRRRPWLVWCGSAAVGLLVVGTGLHFASVEWRQSQPYFHDDFSHTSNGRQHSGGWQAFGGTWQVIDGAMWNITDDRGAKLMNGNPNWHDYTISADVQLLGETGDAGFVIRASQEETGVDSYHGYFAGLRDLDDTLILGRADYGWHEFRAIPVHSGVATGAWYHLKVIAYECIIAVSATNGNGETTIASVNDPSCIEKGRFGLQSYSTGAVWRNVEVKPANQSDLQILLAGQKPVSPDAPPFIPAMTDPQTYQRFWQPMRRELRGHQSNLAAIPIAQLRLLAPDRPTRVTVQGVVTLVSPLLVIQDSTGGVVIPHPELTKPLQIGDDVEASGDADLRDFSPVLRGATVRPFWSHAALPPVAVTAVQASTGAFDARFIETEGQLESEQHTSDGRVVLQLNEASQSFLAIAENPSPAETPLGFEIGSRLRLRGICVTDRAYTKDEIPFALLMRSVEDVQVIETPPWWNAQHIAELVASLLLVSLGLQLVYSSVKRAQLRAVVEERERLAMEMHDTLAQSFVGLGFQLETLCSEAPPGTTMRSQLEATVDLVRFGHMEARRNIAALRPGNLEQLGLAGALEQAAHTLVQGGPIAVSLSVRGEPRNVPLRTADALFRIGQEAVANAARHAKPHKIQLLLAYGKTSLKLSVKDDGIGFLTEIENEGFGIRGLKRRASAIGADLRIRSNPAHGTLLSVRAMLPKPTLFFWWDELTSRTRWREWFQWRSRVRESRSTF